MTFEEDSARHRRASHAMQAGVAMMETWDGPETSKHLRVGINVALVDQAALVDLLIEKGIITKEEYAKAIADAMEAEVERYQEKISRRFPNGPSITLAGADFTTREGDVE